MELYVEIKEILSSQSGDKNEPQHIYTEDFCENPDMEIKSRKTKDGNTQEKISGDAFDKAASGKVDPHITGEGNGGDVDGNADKISSDAREVKDNHLKSLICDVCDAIFTRKCHMWRHRRVIHIPKQKALHMFLLRSQNSITIL